MSVDGSNLDSVSVKGNQLDVENRLYLGGLPHTQTARRINVKLLNSSPASCSTFLHDLNVYTECFDLPSSLTVSHIISPEFL